MLSRSSEIEDLSKVPVVKAPEEEPILSGLSNEKKASVHEMLKQIKNNSVHTR